MLSPVMLVRSATLDPTRSPRLVVQFIVISFSWGHSVRNLKVWKMLTLKVLVTTIDAQWEGMGDVGSARYEPALLPPCPSIRVLRYSN